MNRYTYFITAMKAKLYRRQAWVFSAFSTIQEGPDDWKTNPYPYRLVQTPTKVFFVDPKNNLELTMLDDCVPGQPPFNHKDKVLVKSCTTNGDWREGDAPNLTTGDVESTYGNILANYIVLVYPFHRAMPFMTGRFSPGDLEALILPRLKDQNDPIAYAHRGKTRDPRWLYVDQYLKFTNSMFYLASFSSLWVPAGTEKSMTAPPGIKEFRNKLIAENADRLHDPAVVATIAKKLQEYDRQWLGDDDSTNYMITKKAYEIVRAKKFLMHGAETGLSEGIDVDLIQNSLSEGWDINKFPSMNNSLRAGSYNRGAQTMLGGESVKWLLRASSNINVTVDDCGSLLGNKVRLTENNLKRYLGFSIVVGEGPIKLTVDNIKSYQNKDVVVRSPMYCKLAMTDYCKCCVGERLADNPTGASSAVAEYGSAFLALYMKAAHGKALTLAKMDYRTQLQ